MLVLSRKPGESIKLDDTIEIIVIAVEGHRVRIGIKAPREVRILRAEVDNDLIQANQKSAMAHPESQPELLQRAATAHQSKEGSEQTPH